MKCCPWTVSYLWRIIFRLYLLEEELNEFPKTCIIFQDMAPPYYADLGKKANDVFSKGYHFGVFKLDLKTKSESGVEFTSGIISNHESGKVTKVA